MFDECKWRGIDPGWAIGSIVTDGQHFLSAPKYRDDFPVVWDRLKAFLCKEPQVGDTVRASFTMRAEVWDCLQTAARAAGVTEPELAFLILDRRLKIDREHSQFKASRRVPPSNVVSGPWKPGKGRKVEA
jgi:hypothetical protein